MNKSQRKILQGIIEQLEAAKNSIDDICDEEKNKFDNLPEGLQETEANQKLIENAADLEEAFLSLDECISSIENCIER